MSEFAARCRFSPGRRFAVMGLLGMAVLPHVAACTAGSGSVTRMAEGVRYEGRFINPEAYAAYLLGVERESHADYPGALAAYSEAHTEDPDSPEVWARVGAVRCLANPPALGPAAGRAAWERGVTLDSDFYGNYFERARCAERARTFAPALGDALAAVARRPSDEQVNLLVARILAAQGRTAEARNWLEAFHIYRDLASPAVNRALDRARAVDAHRTPSVEVDSRAHASVLPRSAAFAELRAGQPARARDLAQIELDADPSNADAWIATLVACETLHDEDCFESALGSLNTPSVAPSATALGYLRELLARRTGASGSF